MTMRSKYRVPRPDWSRPLPQPLVIPKVMTLKTLADVRTLVERHLPEDRRGRSTWRYVAKQLADAANGADPPMRPYRCASL